MSTKSAPHRAMIICRAALDREPLIKDGTLWRWRHRRFAGLTVNWLIECGEAIRIGDKIVRAAG